MSYYFELRGWLETSQEDFPKVRDKLMELQQHYADDSQDGRYIKGWCWIEDTINHTHYLNYGAAVRESGLDLLETVLDSITDLGCHVYGYFHAQGEDMERNFAYKVLNDAWNVEETSSLVDWTVMSDDD
jgi:hypothetical protein